jgi:hypothetical protein
MASTGRSVAIYNGLVYDMTNYLTSPPVIVSPADAQPPLQFMDSSVVDLFQSFAGQDITKRLDSLHIGSDVLKWQKTCLRNLFTIGKVETRQSPQCLFANDILLVRKLTVRDRGNSGNPSDNKETREVFVPLSGNGVINPDIKVTPASPGIIIYRFEESYLYPNSSIVQSILVDHVKEYMQRVKAAERPWNDAGSGGGEEQARNIKKPALHGILDFSAV